MFRKYGNFMKSLNFKSQQEKILLVIVEMHKSVINQSSIADNAYIV